jgi:hypothetical protein
MASLSRCIVSGNNAYNHQSPYMSRLQGRTSGTGCYSLQAMRGRSSGCDNSCGHQPIRRSRLLTQSREHRLQLQHHRRCADTRRDTSARYIDDCNYRRHGAHILDHGSRCNRRHIECFGAIRSRPPPMTLIVPKLPGRYRPSLLSPKRKPISYRDSPLG